MGPPDVTPERQLGLPKVSRIQVANRTASSGGTASVSISTDARSPWSLHSAEIRALAKRGRVWSATCFAHSLAALIAQTPPPSSTTPAPSARCTSPRDAVAATLSPAHWSRTARARGAAATACGSRTRTATQAGARRGGDTGSGAPRRAEGRRSSQQPLDMRIVGLVEVLNKRHSFSSSTSLTNDTSAARSTFSNSAF